ncbi:hypothetical protein ACFS07_32080 [Undibacterium arcticum]
MVAYKLYRTGFISWNNWHALDSKLREMWAQEKKRKLRRSPRLVILALAITLCVVIVWEKAMLEFASRTVSSGVLSPVKAAKNSRSKAKKCSSVIGRRFPLWS